MRPEGIRVEPAQSFLSSVRTQEELLRQGETAVHVSVVDRTVLSVGVGVRADAPYLRRAEEEGIFTARRASGGTGVLHREGDLVWAVVLPRSDARVGRDFVRGYRRFGAGLVAALSDHGVSATWVPAPGLSEDYCPLGPRGEVLAVGGGVVGAAAQHLTGTALLHHGTLSLSVDRALVSRLFTFPNPSVVDRLAGLDERGIHERPERLAERVGRALESALGTT